MDIKQTALHLQRLNQPFDVIIVKDGHTRSLYTNCAATNVEGMLNEVVEIHMPDQLIIQEKKRNGTSHKKTERYPISLSLQGLNVEAMNTAHPLPGDYKDYLIGDLKEKNTKLETKCEKLETSNEELKRQNFEYEKELKFKDKEFELAQAKTENERTSTLSGIMETVSANPALASIAATAIGRLMGVEMGAIEAVPEPAARQDDKTVTMQGKVADSVSKWIITLTPQDAKSFYDMVQLLSEDVSQIKEINEILSHSNAA